MATKKKETIEDIYEEVKSTAVSKTTTFEEDIPEPSIEDQIDILLHEKAQYEKKAKLVDKKIEELRQKGVYEEAAKTMRNIRETCLSGGMSEAAIDELLKDIFRKAVLR